MKKKSLAGLSLVILFFAFGYLSAKLQVNEKAPDFTGIDAKGQTHTLSGYRGKIVVLEWLNHDCPFVQKHYNSGHMQKLQKEYTAKGIIWLSVISSAPGKQGYCSPEQALTLTQEKGAAPTAVILDPDGKIGRLYDAKVTPHMFIIDQKGILLYNGGIDNIRSTSIEDIPKATNYVKQALEEILAGKEVSVKTSQPYGCPVKY